MDRDAEARVLERDPPIFLLHIPKTGGNTVVAQFLAHLPVESVWPPPPGLVLDAEGLREATRRIGTLRFIHGHLEGGLTGSLAPEALRMVTLIRHPVRLLVSHYLYLRQQRENRLHAAATALPIEDFLRRFPGLASAPQASYLARALGYATRPGRPLDAAGIGFALAALDRFAFVGVTERMADSLAAMAEEFGLPHFPVTRENAVRVPQDEAENLVARITRDEFLMRLGADFALRRMAEGRLDRWHRTRRRRALAARLEGALAGRGPMPEVVGRAPGVALAFLEGWFAQGWSGEPTSACRYWWSGASAALLVAAAAPRALRLHLRVVNTMGFDAAAITADADDRALDVRAEVAPDGAGVDVTVAIPAELLAAGSVAVTLRAPYALPFSEFDPALDDHAPRGFAVRDFAIDVA